MTSSFFKLSARKWMFLAWGLTVVAGLCINALAQELFYRESLRATPPLPLPAGFPTTTIFSRVNDWVGSGGGPVPASLANAVEIYPEHVAICLIVINRDKIPTSEKARIAKIAGLTSARDAASELDGFIPDDESVAKLRTSFNLLTFEERAEIDRSVIADELLRIKGYPFKSQQIAPSLAQNKP